MRAATLDDTRTLSAQLLELVLADPDLLDIEFAAVMASWDASPPIAPPTVARRAGFGGPARRAPTDATCQSIPADGSEVPQRPTLARSPPLNVGCG
jgi:hypothetical protein